MTDSNNYEQRLRNELSNYLLPQFVNETEETIDHILNQLTINSQSRLSICSESIERSANYLDWMKNDDSQKSSGDQIERDHSFLELKKKTSSEKAEQIKHHEKTIQTIVQEDEPLPRNTLLRPYIESVQGMMLVQKQIYLKEIDLGNDFVRRVGQFCRMYLSNFMKLDKKTAITLGTILKILQKNNQNLDLSRKIDYLTLTQCLAKFQSDLDERHNKLEIIQKVITKISSIIKNLDSKSEETESPKTVKSKDETKRMAFGNK